MEEKNAIFRIIRKKIGRNKPMKINNINLDVFFFKKKFIYIYKMVLCVAPIECIIIKLLQIMLMWMFLLRTNTIYYWIKKQALLLFGS